MERDDQNQNDLSYQLALALLELIEKPIDIELEQPGHHEGLALHGTLLRAFDTPVAHSAPPSLSVMIGAQTLTIRLAPIEKIAVRRPKSTLSNRLRSIHILLTDGFTLHINAQPQHLQPPNNS